MEGVYKFNGKSIYSEHKSVKYSKKHVDPINNACMNDIESQWAILKAYIIKCQ